MYSNNHRKSFLKLNKKYYEFLQKKFPIYKIPPFSIIHNRDIFISKFTFIKVLLKINKKKFPNEAFSKLFILFESPFYYFLNLKDLKNENFNKFIKTIFLYNLKLIFSLIDFCFLFILGSVFSIFVKRKKTYNFESIRTIYFNAKRQNKSHEYYYKDGLNPQQCLYIIVERDSYPSLTSYYIDYYLKENNYFSPLHSANFINIIKSLYFSLRDLFVSVSLLRFSKLHFFTVLENIVNLNSTLFYYISYFSLKDFIGKNIRKISTIEILNWYEGQRSNFILPFILRHFRIEFTSFIGFSFSNSFYPHQIPSEYQLKEKLLGKKILFQDNQSVEEFKILLNQYNFNKISCKHINKKFSRGAFNDIDLGDKLIKKKFNKSILYLSHASLSHTYMGLSILAAHLNKNKKEYLKFKYLFIRLHPALRNKFDFDFIYNLNLPKNLVPKFRNESSVTPQDLILFSDIVASADSNLLNFSLFKNKKTFGVLTDFRFDPPINKIYRDSNNLQFI